MSSLEHQAQCIRRVAASFDRAEQIMGRKVKLNRIESALQGLEYPIERVTAADQLADVQLLLADGEANLGELLASAGDDEFESPEDLISGIHNTLPRAAVGDPYQSDGDA